MTHFLSRATVTRAATRGIRSLVLPPLPPRARQERGTSQICPMGRLPLPSEPFRADLNWHPFPLHPHHHHQERAEEGERNFARHRPRSRAAFDAPPPRPLPAPSPPCCCAHGPTAPPVRASTLSIGVHAPQPPALPYQPAAETDTTRVSRRPPGDSAGPSLPGRAPTPRDRPGPGLGRHARPQRPSTVVGMRPPPLSGSSPPPPSSHPPCAACTCHVPPPPPLPLAALRR